MTGRIVNYVPDPRQVTTSGGDWRVYLEKIREKRADYSRDVALATPLEKDRMEREIKAFTDTWKAKIEAGVIGEYDQLVDIFSKAHKQVQAAKAQEINRWDPARLSNELSVTRQLVDNALQSDNPGPALARLREEARQSGDINKQRAVAEVMAGVLGKAGGATTEVRLTLNRAARQAERDLVELRTTEGLQRAAQVASDAFDAMQAKKRELFEVVEPVIGISSAIMAAAAKVVIGENGEVEVRE